LNPVGKAASVVTRVNYLRELRAATTAMAAINEWIRQSHHMKKGLAED
jgi:hypothetical protein